MLSIIVLTRNRLEYTKQTIAALVANTTAPHEFIFIDNCSNDGTKKYLRSIKGRTNAKKEVLIFNRYNYGVAGGRNAGMIQARGQYIMTIDNDIVVPKDYDKHIIAACNNIKDLGMIGINVEKHDYPIVERDGVKIQLKPNNIGGGCICIPRYVFRKVGYYSTDFVYGGEDCDMFIRMKYLKLINGYIVPRGIHLGANDKNEYKTQAHSAGSAQVNKVAANVEKYVRYKSVYVPYSAPVFRKDGKAR